MNIVSMSKYECDFSDISDSEIVTVTQLLEASFKQNTLDQHVGLPLFSDITDDELLMSFNDEIVGHYCNVFVQVYPRRI